MPGMALRMAASITVAPFSTSMVRVSRVWSTKWILAMMLVLPGGSGGLSYNGSIRFAPALGCKRSDGPGVTASSGPVEDCLDRRAGFREAVVQCCEGTGDVGLLQHGGFQPVS